MGGALYARGARAARRRGGALGPAMDFFQKKIYKSCVMTYAKKYRRGPMGESWTRRWTRRTGREPDLEAIALNLKRVCNNGGPDRLDAVMAVDKKFKEIIGDD